LGEEKFVFLAFVAGVPGQQNELSFLLALEIEDILGVGILC
jgi:hypothetical protein